jgi:translation initiation factor 1
MNNEFDNEDIFESDNSFRDDLDKEFDDKIHLRVVKRNGRKCLTTIEGFTQDEPKKFLKLIKKKLCCNGNVTSTILGQPILQFQGDHRSDIREILIIKYKIKEKQIVKHGF